MYYKLSKPSRETGQIVCVFKINDDGSGLCIPFAPANTDYANFKREINDETAQLQDADGNLMTAEQAKEFVASLP